MEQNPEPLSQTPSLQQIPPIPPTKLPSSKKISTKIIIAVSLVFLLFISIAGAYYFGTQSNKTLRTQDTEQLPRTSSPTPTPSTITRSDFSTYTNNEIGIEFTYPNSFKDISSESEGCIDNKSNKRIDTPEGIHVFSLNKGNDSFPFMSTFIPYTGNCESPARGGGWVDYARGITSKEDISQYCEKQKTEDGTSNCITFTNPNGVLITKSVQQGYPGESTIMYRMKAIKPDVNGIVLYDAVLKEDFKNAEEILDNIVNSLKLTN